MAKDETWKIVNPAIQNRARMAASSRNMVILLARVAARAAGVSSRFAANPAHPFHDCLVARRSCQRSRPPQAGHFAQSFRGEGGLPRRGWLQAARTRYPAVTSGPRP